MEPSQAQKQPKVRSRKVVNSQESLDTSSIAPGHELPLIKQENKQERRARMWEKTLKSHCFCINHLNVCGCPFSDFKIVQRFTNQELLFMIQEIDAAVAKAK
mmetsp:Transcript_11041/g.18466  ORF Transcript_11041/g.18466 Transcript_11041/m.18466 type:complete len:102 (-) Transcript_11041:128-433(-)